MKAYLLVGLLLLAMVWIRASHAAVIHSTLLPEEGHTDSSKAMPDCSLPGVLFKTTGGLEICVDPKELWMQKALDILKKRFRQR
ncbi:C-C motif chemokine 18-like [Hemiscyllium ocellatum]|uniref:C-C motif chemokine 18-like n=1 Tax=Hemiscyllium ocellatum TaxID=170820 RepID=UPI00296750D4|nr:C-C motif chemokine 18-like [Hemiscyllium ocellatum]